MMRALIATIVTLSVSAAYSAETRTWTSKDGSATMVATFNKLEGDNVVLILQNGRSQVVKKEFLSDDDVNWIEQNAGATGAAAAPSQSASETAAIPAALKGRLIDDKGNDFDLGVREGGYPKYYMFYYSASWCGPCCAYSPEVVRFAKRMKSESFTVVLVPNDRSLEDEIAYLKEFKMPWPGLKWSSKGYRGIPNNPGGGIPAARLVDAEGKTLLTTEDVNRMDFLDEVKKIVRTGSAGS